MSEIKKISVFQYRSLRAQAEMNQAKQQQAAFELLLELGYRREWAEAVTEAALDLNANNELTQEEADRVNAIMAKVRHYKELYFKINQTTVLV
jgi:hypothetical protein